MLMYIINTNKYYFNIYVSVLNRGPCLLLLISVYDVKLFTEVIAVTLPHLSTH